MDYTSWNGVNSFTNSSYSGNTNFCQLVTVVNTNGTYTISQTINFGSAKTAPSANSTGLSVYTPWATGSDNYRLGVYVMLL